MPDKISNDFLRDYFNIDDALPEYLYYEIVEGCKRKFLEFTRYFNENTGNDLWVCVEMLQHKSLVAHKGLGAVYRLLSLYFEKDRNSIMYKVIQLKAHNRIYYNRRSVKATKFPLRNKSWKGRR